MMMIKTTMVAVDGSDDILVEKWVYTENKNKRKLETQTVYIYALRTPVLF